jgi:hypothetical protein
MKKYLLIIITLIILANCSALKKINLFGFGGKKNDFDKYGINEFLWKSSYNILSKYPNTDTDLKEGFISTDWIVLKKNSNTKFRITVYILGLDIIEENLEIITDKEVNINGKWTKTMVSRSFNENLRQLIISRAHSLDPGKYDN